MTLKLGATNALYNYGATGQTLGGGHSSVTVSRLFICKGSATKLSVVVSNALVGGTNANSIRVKATLFVRYDGATFPLVYKTVNFGGVRTATLAPGQTLASDPIDYVTMDGANVFALVYYSTTLGTAGQFPMTAAPQDHYIYDADRTDAYSDGADPSDAVLLFSTATAVNAPFPLALVTDTDRASVAIYGDSIAFGLNDSGSDLGYIARAVQPHGVLTWQMAQPGEKASEVAEGDLRLALAGYCTRATCEYGINDINAGAGAVVTLAALRTVWAQIVAQGTPVYQATLLPVSTSTDGWVTAGNQTPNANNSARVTLNAALRERPAPLAGVLDVAQAIETASGSGKWLSPGGAALTGDGLHPNPAGYALAATVIPYTQFALPAGLGEIPGATDGDPGGGGQAVYPNQPVTLTARPFGVGGVPGSATLSAASLSVIGQDNYSDSPSVTVAGQTLAATLSAGAPLGNARLVWVWHQVAGGIASDHTVTKYVTITATPTVDPADVEQLTPDGGGSYMIAVGESRRGLFWALTGAELDGAVSAVLSIDGSEAGFAASCPCALTETGFLTTFPDNWTAADLAPNGTYSGRLHVVCSDGTDLYTESVFLRVVPA